jgi:predicted RNA-binding protein Jag
MDILNNFSGVGGLSEAEQAALDLVKADIIAAMGDLGLEVAAIDDAVNDLTDAVGSVANGEEDASGLYGYIDQAIADLKAAGLTNEEVEAAITDIVGNPATTDEEGNPVDATGIYATLADLGTSIDALNDISVEDVNNIVADAISGLENLSEEDVDSIVSDIVGTPAEFDADGNVTTPATGLYATIGDLNNISEEDVTAIVTAAIGGLENISEDDVSTIVDGIIGSPATDDEDASGIYGYVDNTTDEILDILGNPATDEEDATGVYGYIDDAVDSLGTDLATLAGNVGTPAELDADGNVVTPATGIYAQVQDLMDQGLTNAEAIASLAVEFGVAVTDLTNLINAQTDTITEDVGEVAEDVESISGLLGQPAIADNPLTEEDESADPTGLFGIIAGYETAGQERDEAINSALDDLATQLGTTKTDILDQLDLGLDQIETLITDSQTAVEEKIDKAVEDIGVDLGEMETEILEKMAEYEADGIDRDDALALAISDVSDQLGQTETDILDALASTETDILTELGTTEADILAALAETETTLASDIDAVSNLVGKPATEVTQTDIDFVVDVIAGQQVIEENQQDLLAQYDVTGDGQITLDDQTLLEQLLAGEQVYDQIADTSIYAPTGTYGAISDAEINLDTKIDENLDTTLDAITEMESNIVTNIEDEALRAGGRQFLQQALQAPDAMGQQVTVRTPDPLNLRYIYDFNSIFANPQQAGMFPSPYAKGGQVEDTTDKLLNIIGGS